MSENKQPGIFPWLLLLCGPGMPDLISSYAGSVEEDTGAAIWPHLGGAPYVLTLPHKSPSSLFRFGHEVLLPIPQVESGMARFVPGKCRAGSPKYNLTFTRRDGYCEMAG